jgi:ADP-ribosylglycohydrolase
LEIETFGGNSQIGCWKMNAVKPADTDHERRLDRARLALDGLSVGDGFGQQFFAVGMRGTCLASRQPPPGRWRVTDDTEMAISIFETLADRREIDQALLASRFGSRFLNDPSRGYGPAMHQLLRELGNGGDWREYSRSLFDGAGSFGNGSAMRVAPVGAYFADDFEAVATQAARSAEVTHAHPNGIAGAVAVAIATAWCARRVGLQSLDGQEMLDAVIEHTPDGSIHRAIQKALGVPLDEWEYTAANLLGNGSRITVADTVPFCLWCAAAHLNSYSDALWAAMHVEGDIDTNCAIIGGIVASAVGRPGIPSDWFRSRESLFIEFESSED